MNTSFPVGNRDNIVVHLALLEVCICALELYIGSAVFETAAMFEYFFQTDACVAGCSYSTFAPLA